MNEDNMSVLVEYSSTTEKSVRGGLLDLFRKNPIPDEQILSNLGIFLESKNLARLLFLDFIYKLIVPIQGVIMDFGTRWGQNLSIFESLRGIYEPFNRHRKLVGFDTFAGFLNVNEEDGNAPLMKTGQLATPTDYDNYLAQVMLCKEQLNPLAHVKKFDIRVGDASEEIHKYLEAYPATVIALVYFDFDLYEPTRNCLLAVENRLTKGSVVVFDELNDEDSPGETAALMEVIGLGNIRLQRYPYASRVSYYVVE